MIDLTTNVPTDNAGLHCCRMRPVVYYWWSKKPGRCVKTGLRYSSVQSDWLET